jgi:hypothetical protein
MFKHFYVSQKKRNYTVCTNENLTITYKNNLSKWVTERIRISCNRKRGLVILCRHSNDINLKIYLKQYSKILSKVILASKKLNYNNGMTCPTSM